MTLPMIPPLCYITEASDSPSMLAQCRAAARGGAGWIQLRHKTLPDTEFAALARQIMVEIAPYGAKLLVNDRIDVAIEVGTPGLHIGQGDGDPAEIRSRIGSEMLLGLSVEEAEHIQAVPDGVDYLGVGPIYATGSKPDHAAPIGVEGFAEIASLTSLPCLAIGGVTERDAAAIKRAGGAGLAVISAISRAPDMETATRTLLNAWRKA
jgi:thiamine-phosphate pyrophosphorylase